MTTTSNLAHAVRPMPLERVRFFDGMILSANDLEAEREYHLARSRLINRALFGCGIACGLEVEEHPAGDRATRFVCIKPGVAFDCCGDPLELCRPVKLDLDPDPCKPPPSCVCILIRRRDDKPEGGDTSCCNKAAGEGPHRVREYVEIRVVDCRNALEGVCRTPSNTASHDAGECDPGESNQDLEHDLCSCLKACESCNDCGEGWILLACVTLRKPREPEDCPSDDRDRWVIEGEIDRSGRRYIKPIRCHCPPKPPERKERPKAPPPGDDYRAKAEVDEPTKSKTQASREAANKEATGKQTPKRQPKPRRGKGAPG